LPLKAVADTCFLIDWAYYRHKEALFDLFKAIYVTESVLNELSDEPVISWVSEELARGRMGLLSESPDVSSEAYRLMFLSRREVRLRDLDYPEAVCLVLGKMLDLVVLTENRAAVMAPFFLEECRDLNVWRALEVIRELILRGIIECAPNETSVRVPFEEYMLDTRHLFSPSELKRVVEVIVRCLRR